MFSLWLAATVISTAGQQTEEAQEDGPGDGTEEQRANRGCTPLLGCKEFTKDPFKIKQEFSNLIGFKKNAKNGTSLSGSRPSITRRPLTRSTSSIYGVL